MTRLAAGGRAAQPGLLCAWWFRSRARANRKARIQAAAMRVHDERAVTLSKAPGSGTDTMTHDSAQKRSQRRHGNAGTAT